MDDEKMASGAPAFPCGTRNRVLHPILAAILLLDAHASAPQSPDLSPLLNASRDEIVRRAVVPSALIPQAEVRLIRRGGSIVMRTAIRSPFLGRVIGEIRKKESSAWTPGREGHEDSERYLFALDRGYREAERMFRERNDGEDGRRSLLIEFVISKEEAFVAFLDPEIRGDFGNIRIASRHILEVLPLSRRYVWENMQEIGIDSLGWSRREAEETLKPFAPPGPPDGTGPHEKKEGIGRSS